MKNTAAMASLFSHTIVSDRKQSRYSRLRFRRFENWKEHLDFLLPCAQMMRARSLLFFEDRQAEWGRARGRREVGLRIALGALPQQIALRFLFQGLRVSIVGCLFGLALAAASVRLLSGMLYGVSSFDPATFGGVVVLVLLVAALATLLPGARAARTDPMRVLRDE
jgi:FtsX-like permease family